MLRESAVNGGSYELLSKSTCIQLSAKQAMNQNQDRTGASSTESLDVLSEGVLYVETSRGFRQGRASFAVFVVSQVNVYRFQFSAYLLRLCAIICRSFRATCSLMMGLDIKIELEILLR
jgi:hypothetical protein